MDFGQIRQAAEGYREAMTSFLRDLVSIPGESAQEKGHILRIKEEMEKPFYFLPARVEDVL